MCRGGISSNDTDLEAVNLLKYCSAKQSDTIRLPV